MAENGTCLWLLWTKWKGVSVGAYILIGHRLLKSLRKHWEKKKEKASAGETSASKEQKFTKCEIIWIFLAPVSRYCRFYLIELFTNGQKRTCGLADNANAQKIDFRSLFPTHYSYEL